MNKKVLVVLIVALFAIILLIASISIVITNLKNNSVLKLKDANIKHDEKFGGIYVDISIEDFNALGFEFGDSVNIKLSNGYELYDLPYYNGYYVDMGEALLVGYPKYEYIKIGINYGNDVWLLANCKEEDTITITLNEKGKYKDIQESSDIHYVEEQGELSDVVFTNFRNVKVGGLKDNTLYRSASPIDNTHNRAAVTDKLAKAAEINYDVDLSDSDGEITEHIDKADFNSPYFVSLLRDNKVVALDMSMNFKAEDFKDGLVKGLTEMSKNEGPYLVHCVEGKDRTGFVCMILEGLCGASYDEIIDDYMLTYDNYYGITKETEPTKYETIKARNIDAMLKYITGVEDTENLKNVDYSKTIFNYLLAIGMKSDDILNLKSNLTYTIYN